MSACAIAFLSLTVNTVMIDTINVLLRWFKMSHKKKKTLH